jgi:hypothetical protein
MDRVGFYARFKDGKGRKFFYDQVMQQFNGKLLAFIMPDIGNYQARFGIKKFMIFHISRNIKIGALAFGLVDEESTTAAANGYLFNGFSA